MKREEYYIKYFEQCQTVLDIGCGDGIFLELLKKNNIIGVGVDINERVVNICKDKGLTVFQGDAVDFLRDKTNNYDGIYISHVIEHLLPEKVVSLIKSSFFALKPSGILIVITPDAKNIKDLLGGFWEDATHIRPYPLPLLEKIFKGAGLNVVKSVERRNVYSGKFLWQTRDFFRNILVGDFWGRDEVCIIGKKIIL
ncbi:MAG: class I SAM-dependent methyltransferase [Candidatus Firestonebacteria bacterium]